MNRKGIVVRQAAHDDIRQALDFYLTEAESRIAFSFIDALERTFRQIGLHPAAGSPRYALELDIPDLRFWLVGAFPYLVFYREEPEHVDIWRVLHAERDLPEALRALE